MIPRERKLISFAIILIVFILLYNFQESNGFYCTQSFCDDYTSPYQYPCPEAKNCTDVGFRTFLDPDSTCNCCEYCFSYLKENDVCETHSPRKPTEMCGPHLTCVKGNSDTEPGRCQKMIQDPMDPRNENFCMKRKHEYEVAKEEGNLMIAQVNPDCDADGNYAPRQCLSGTVCYCSDWKGNRIFGLALPDQYQDCACSRDVAKLKELGFSGKFPHCLPNGDYDELQCVVRTCFCRSHPEELVAMHNLNQTRCYDPKIHIFEPETPRFYVKDCELKRARLEIQIAEAEIEGRRTIVADIPKCDEDGSYASIQSDFDSLYCAFPENGTQIQPYEAKKFSLAAIQMNCFCARDRYILRDSANAKPKCCSNGNYRPWQCQGGRCFCVDPMGRQEAHKGQVYDGDPELIKQLDCYYPDPESVGKADPGCDYEKIHEEYYKEI